MALGSSPVRFRTKQEYVYQALRGAIMTGELPPGQRLVIDDIARRLEVSAIPIREALQSLQAEGLVVSAPHVGATVTSVSQDEIHEVFSIMEGLEMVAVREAARRLTPEQGEAVAAIVAEMDRLVEKREYESWAAANGNLHRTIGEIAAMPLLVEMTDRALSRWERLRRHYFQGVLVPRVEQAQREHRELLGALLEHDADLAERVVRAHNHNARTAYADYLERQPPSGA